MGGAGDREPGPDVLTRGEPGRAARRRRGARLGPDRRDDPGVSEHPDGRQAVPAAVVAAVHAQALGGGCELALQSARVQAAAESYMGLVELLVGVIPAGGGCKEFVIRSGECVPGEAGAGELWGPLHRAFETIGLAKVSTSAAEAREPRFPPAAGCGLESTRPAPSRTRSRWPSPWRGPAISRYRQRTDIPVLGKSALARFKMDVYLAERAGHISAFDRRLGTSLATVLCGGPLTATRQVSEQVPP